MCGHPAIASPPLLLDTTIPPCAISINPLPGMAKVLLLDQPFSVALIDKLTNQSGTTQLTWFAMPDAPEGVRKNRSCEFCRMRKVRCDGQKPSCRTCINHQRECFYKPSSLKPRYEYFLLPRNDDSQAATYCGCVIMIVLY